MTMIGMYILLLNEIGNRITLAKIKFKRQIRQVLVGNNGMHGLRVHTFNICLCMLILLKQFLSLKLIHYSNANSCVAAGNVIRSMCRLLNIDIVEILLSYLILNICVYEIIKIVSSIFDLFVNIFLYYIKCL